MMSGKAIDFRRPNQFCTILSSPNRAAPRAIAFAPLPFKFFSEKSADFPKTRPKRAPFGPVYRCTLLSIQFLLLSCPTDQTQRGNKKTIVESPAFPDIFGHATPALAAKAIPPAQPHTMNHK
jgi:hypothetical protein